MNIFSSILQKIFPPDHPAAAPSASGASTVSTTTTVAAPAPAAPPVDVDAVLNGLAAKEPQPLNWQTSIVDLMKLLKLDSSFTARKQLAHELGYTGDTNDSATMNVWLHKEVMAKLEASGGTVPDSLKT